MKGREISITLKFVITVPNDSVARGVFFITVLAANSPQRILRWGITPGRCRDLAKSVI